MTICAIKIMFKKQILSVFFFFFFFKIFNTLLFILFLQQDMLFQLKREVEYHSRLRFFLGKFFIIVNTLKFLLLITRLLL